MIQKKIISFLVFLMISVALLFQVTPGHWVQAADNHYKGLQKFTKIMNLVKQYYVEKVDIKKLIYGGINGMLAELDPHTNYLRPEVFKEFQNETAGKFGGLGIEISLQKEALKVISAIEDTPAWKAGIQAGDRIISVDKKKVKGLSLVEAAQLMRGPLGTRVLLEVSRKGHDGTLKFNVKRAEVKVRSVKYVNLDDGYAYIRLTSFIENSYKDFKRALKRHERSIKKGKTKGLIIDLRRNPGGLLDQAVQLSDLFLEKGIIVSTIGRNKNEKEIIRATEQGSRIDFPIIVIVNEYSASASEILAGALQDNKRAIIMGRRSFGKGSVQSVIKLGDGSGLKMTVARYYTPSGRAIQAHGIIPDIVLDKIDPEAFEKAVIQQYSRREKDMDKHLKAEKINKIKDESSRSFYYWMKQSSAGKSKNSAKVRLLSKDFEVVQALNYIKTWRLMKTLDKL